MAKKEERAIHTVDELEVYLDCFLEKEGIAFQEWIERFGCGIYLLRNELMLEMLRPLKPKRVLEFACAGGFLAKLLLDHTSTIELYVCSNFSSRINEYCVRQLRNYRNCLVKLADANVRRASDMHRQNLIGYDLIVTTSFEHIEFDRDLIQELPPGVYFAFSVASFDDPEHFRTFQNQQEIEDRYSEMLEILEVRTLANNQKFIVLARKRTHAR